LFCDSTYTVRSTPPVAANLTVFAPAPDPTPTPTLRTIGLKKLTNPIRVKGAGLQRDRKEEEAIR